MLSSAWFRFGLLLTAVGLFAVATTPAMGREPPAYGQRLVAQYQLPPDAIARFAAMAAGSALSALPRENSMFADRSPWVGPAKRAGVGHNPYTLVFTVSGVTKAAGEVYAQWQAGWEVHESPIASREVLMVVPPIARTGVTAGQALTLTASSARVSFRGERSVAPMLGLVQVRNLDINDVQIQVWSGAAPQTWAELPLSRAELFALGVTCLLVWLGFKYWQPAVRETCAQPSHSREPLRETPDETPHETPASASAVACVEAAAAHDMPVPATPNHEAQVVAALYQVLTGGMTVHTVLDETRMRRRPAAA